MIPPPPPSLCWQCHNEVYKMSLNDIDIFVGIQQSRIDVKNPMPTR